MNLVSNLFFSEAYAVDIASSPTNKPAWFYPKCFQDIELWSYPLK